MLSQFDIQADEFSPQRVQDELIGQMSELLGIDYDVLALDLTESESRHRALVSDPTRHRRRRHCLSLGPLRGRRSNQHHPRYSSTFCRPPCGRADEARGRCGPERASAASPAAAAGGLLDEHIISPAPTTERLQSIQRMVADQLGDVLPPDFSANVLQSIPVQAGGLYPISDIWHIDPGLDTPDRLRIHIAQFAREIAGEADLDACVEDRSDGIGFACRAPAQVSSPLARAVLALLVSWPVSSRPTSAWTSGTSSPTCQRCCMARANVMTTGPGD